MKPSTLLFAKAIKSIGGGLACSGLTGAGVGVGLVFGSLLRAYAVSPTHQAQLFSYALLGFALAEAIGLLSLMMACIILYT